MKEIRERFDRWASRKGYPLEYIRSMERYVSQPTEDAWQAWQAAWFAGRDDLLPAASDGVSPEPPK